MSEYILFLDESKPNPPSTLFSLGGCIIEKDLYEKSVIPFINDLKNKVFGDISVILHESDIRQACKPEYKIMRITEKRTLFWSGMAQFFDNTPLSVLCSVIEPSLVKKIYNSKFLNDEYFIALQIIMENYAHFLEFKNSKGCIILESRNAKEDTRLQDHYYSLRKHGTLFLSRFSMQNYITTLNFNAKPDNIIGLQLADFIPNTMKKHSANIAQKSPSISSNIYKRIYDGNIGNIDRFGIKKIP